MQDALREALGCALYEQAKEHRLYRDLTGDIIEWERLRARSKEEWRARGELAVSTFFRLATAEDVAEEHAQGHS